jgi:hypothetical protein
LPELRSRSDQNEQRGKRAAFGDATQKVKRAWISPVRIFNGQYYRLRPRTCHDQVRQRRHLPTSQFIRGQ